MFDFNNFVLDVNGSSDEPLIVEDEVIQGICFQDNFYKRPVVFCNCKFTNCRFTNSCFKFEYSTIENSVFSGGGCFTLVNTDIYNSLFVKGFYAGVWDTVEFVNCIFRKLTIGVRFVTPKYVSCKFIKTEFTVHDNDSKFFKCKFVSSVFMDTFFTHAKFSKSDFYNHGFERCDFCNFSKLVSCRFVNSNFSFTKLPYELAGNKFINCKLDYASVPLCCGTLYVDLGERGVAQWLYHAAALDISSIPDDTVTGKDLRNAVLYLRRTVGNIFPDTYRHDSRMRFGNCGEILPYEDYEGEQHV